MSCDGVVAGAGSEIQETNVASEGKLGVDCFGSVSHVGIAAESLWVRKASVDLSLAGLSYQWSSVRKLDCCEARNIPRQVLSIRKMNIDYVKLVDSSEYFPSSHI